jgi:mutual gliding-motility protein MglA
MAFVSHKKKQVNAKILVVGPKGSGKTTNLRSIYAATSDERKRSLMEFDPDVQSTPIFDFLPVSLGAIEDYHVRMHMYSFNPIIPFDDLLAVLVHGADGILYVLDSHWQAVAENYSCITAIRRLLERNGIDYQELTHLLQYNKQDSGRAISIEEMNRLFNTTNFVCRPAIASQGQGPMECLEILAKSVLERLAVGSKV